MPSQQFKTNAQAWIVRGLYAAGAAFVAVAGYGIANEAGAEWPQYSAIVGAAVAALGKAVSWLTEKSK